MKYRGWLPPRWLCAIGLRPRSISLLSKRLPLRLHYSGVLPPPLSLSLDFVSFSVGPFSLIGAFGLGVCTLAVCRGRACVCVHVHAPMLLFVLCTPLWPRGWAGMVCGCIRLIAGRGLSGEHREQRRVRLKRDGVEDDRETPRRKERQWDRSFLAPASKRTTVIPASPCARILIPSMNNGVP